MTIAVAVLGTRRRRVSCIAALSAGAIASLLAALASPADAPADDAPKQIASVEDLWRGFDPEAQPLDVETIRTWEEDGAAFQTLRFTGETAGDAKVRVYAIQGAPRGQGSSRLLHVHGGGQTASLDWVRFWAKRGYVCVSFDFCGRWEKRTDFTDWGPIKQGNMAEAAGGFQLRPTPRESSWYHWTLVSRRALTLLARHPQADPTRLGVFGVSVGGSLTWMIAGSDSRVKAAVPIYGCGYNYDRRNARWNILVPNDDYNLFQRVLSPEAHAPFVSCPLLFLSATNDGHGLMDRAYDALGATTGPKYQAFSPRTDHHVEPREGRNLELWMDWQLKGGAAWPSSPDLRLTLEPDGTPAAVVAPDAASDVSAVDVYYALGDKRPQVRFWREADATRRAKEWRASLPVLDSWDDLRAFANVTYRSGVCLSTPCDTPSPRNSARRGRPSPGSRRSSKAPTASTTGSSWAPTRTPMWTGNICKPAATRRSARSSRSTPSISATRSPSSSTRISSATRSSRAAPVRRCPSRSAATSRTTG